MDADMAHREINRIYGTASYVDSDYIQNKFRQLTIRSQQGVISTINIESLMSIFES